MDKTSMILIIDDNPTNLSVLFEYLEESGFEVAVAQNGAKAFQQIDFIKPDLVLLDVMMPGIDGFEICRRLKNSPATQDIPVIFMTALADDIDKVKGFLAGGADYITKPFHHEEALVRINAQLRIRQLEQQLRQQHRQIETQQDQLGKQQEALKQVQGCKEKVLSCISEHLQPPLNTMLGFTRLLDEHIETFSRDDLKLNVKRLRATAENLSILYENLLLWSQIQQQTIPFHPEPIHLDEIAIYNILRLTAQADAKNLSLTMDIPEPMLVVADYTLIDVVLRNLLSNAVKFTKSGGTIHVAARAQDQVVVVDISDSGIGMPSDLLTTLFHADKICQTQPKTEEQGTGLGLLLCKDVIEKHGGMIWVESELGKGSTFHFTLAKEG